MKEQEEKTELTRNKAFIIPNQIRSTNHDAFLDYKNKKSNLLESINNLNDEAENTNIKIVKLTSEVKAKEKNEREEEQKNKVEAKENKKGKKEKKKK